MSPLAILVHAWRVRRLTRAMRTLNRRLAAYETAYGLPPFACVRSTTT